MGNIVGTGDIEHSLSSVRHQEWRFNNLLEGVGGMNTLTRLIQMVEKTVEQAQDAQSVWEAFVDAAQTEYPQIASGAKDGADHLAAFLRRAHPLLDQLKDMDEMRRARFADVPILQAKLSFADGTERRVAVSKPTDTIEEPHIGEMFYAALKKQGVVASCEVWSVVVVDRRNRVVAEIPRKEQPSAKQTKFMV